MKTHCRIHTGEKPYKCTYNECKRVFKAHGHLKDHYKRHLKSKDINCGICSKKFRNLVELRQHEKTNHSGVSSVLSSEKYIQSAGLEKSEKKSCAGSSRSTNQNNCQNQINKIELLKNCIQSLSSNTKKAEDDARALLQVIQTTFMNNYLNQSTGFSSIHYNGIQAFNQNGNLDLNNLNQFINNWNQSLFYQNPFY